MSGSSEPGPLRAGDYIAPGYARIQPDACFPNMIEGDRAVADWTFLRREIPHRFYVDRRSPSVGFVSRDEAHILFNTARRYPGVSALEIGCWLGWSACHLALGGARLDVIDPLLAEPDIHASVRNSLFAAGVMDHVTLVPGASPARVFELSALHGRRWNLFFIDGNHEAPAPLQDAKTVATLAPADALVLFHDMVAPAVAAGLAHFRALGWQTMLYQTMQIMGVAWRGTMTPLAHVPDPAVDWTLPSHLDGWTISGG